MTQPQRSVFLELSASLGLNAMVERSKIMKSLKKSPSAVIRTSLGILALSDGFLRFK